MANYNIPKAGKIYRSGSLFMPDILISDCFAKVLHVDNVNNKIYAIRCTECGFHPLPPLSTTIDDFMAKYLEEVHE